MSEKYRIQVTCKCSVTIAKVKDKCVFPNTLGKGQFSASLKEMLIPQARVCSHATAGLLIQ